MDEMLGKWIGENKVIVSYCVKEYANTVKELWNYLNILSSNKNKGLNLPGHSTRYRLIRSPHVNKKSMELFSTKNKKSIQVIYNKESLNLFVNFINNYCNRSIFSFNLYIRIVYLNILRVYLLKTKKILNVSLIGLGWTIFFENEDLTPDYDPRAVGSVYTDFGKIMNEREQNLGLAGDCYNSFISDGSPRIHKNIMGWEIKNENIHESVNTDGLFPMYIEKNNELQELGSIFKDLYKRQDLPHLGASDYNGLILYIKKDLGFDYLYNAYLSFWEMPFIRFIAFSYILYAIVNYLYSARIEFITNYILEKTEEYYKIKGSYLTSIKPRDPARIHYVSKFKAIKPGFIQILLLKFNALNSWDTVQERKYFEVSPPWKYTINYGTVILLILAYHNYAKKEDISNLKTQRLVNIKDYSAVWRFMRDDITHFSMVNRLKKINVKRRGVVVRSYYDLRDMTKRFDNDYIFGYLTKTQLDIYNKSKNIELRTNIIKYYLSEVTFIDHKIEGCRQRFIDIKYLFIKAVPGFIDFLFITGDNFFKWTQKFLNNPITCSVDLIVTIILFISYCIEEYILKVLMWLGVNSASILNYLIYDLGPVVFIFVEDYIIWLSTFLGDFILHIFDWFVKLGFYFLSIFLSLNIFLKGFYMSFKFFFALIILGVTLMLSRGKDFILYTFDNIIPTLLDLLKRVLRGIFSIIKDPCVAFVEYIKTSERYWFEWGSKSGYYDTRRLTWIYQERFGDLLNFEKVYNLISNIIYRFPDYIGYLYFHITYYGKNSFWCFWKKTPFFTMDDVSWGTFKKCILYFFESNSYSIGRESLLFKFWFEEMYKFWKKYFYAWSPTSASIYAFFNQPYILLRDDWFFIKKIYQNIIWGNFFKRFWRMMRLDKSLLDFLKSFYYNEYFILKTRAGQSFPKTRWLYYYNYSFKFFLGFIYSFLNKIYSYIKDFIYFIFIDIIFKLFNYIFISGIYLVILEPIYFMFVSFFFYFFNKLKVYLNLSFLNSFFSKIFEGWIEFKGYWKIFHYYWKFWSWLNLQGKYIFEEYAIKKSYSIYSVFNDKYIIRRIIFGEKIIDKDPNPYWDFKSSSFYGLRYLINLKENTIDSFIYQSLVYFGLPSKNKLEMYNVLKNNPYNNEYAYAQKRVWWLPKDFIIYFDRRCFFILEKFLIFIYEKVIKYSYVLKRYVSEYFITFITLEWLVFLFKFLLFLPFYIFDFFASPIKHIEFWKNLFLQELITLKKSDLYSIFIDYINFIRWFTLTFYIEVEFFFVYFKKILKYCYGITFNDYSLRDLIGDYLCWYYNISIELWPENKKKWLSLWVHDFIFMKLADRRFDELSWMQYDLRSHINLFDKYYLFWLSKYKDSSRLKYVKLKLESKGYTKGKFSYDLILLKNFELIDIFYFGFYIIFYNFSFFLTLFINKLLIIYNFLLNFYFYKDFCDYFFFNFYLKFKNNLNYFYKRVLKHVLDNTVVMEQWFLFKNCVNYYLPIFFLDLFYIIKLFIIKYESDLIRFVYWLVHIKDRCMEYWVYRFTDFFKHYIESFSWYTYLITDFNAFAILNATFSRIRKEFSVKPWNFLIKFEFKKVFNQFDNAFYILIKNYSWSDGSSKASEIRVINYIYYVKYSFYYIFEFIQIVIFKLLVDIPKLFYYFICELNIVDIFKFIFYPWYLIYFLREWQFYVKFLYGYCIKEANLHLKIWLEFKYIMYQNIYKFISYYIKFFDLLIKFELHYFVFCVLRPFVGTRIIQVLVCFIEFYDYYYVVWLGNIKNFKEFLIYFSLVLESNTLEFYFIYLRYFVKHIVALSISFVEMFWLFLNSILNFIFCILFFNFWNLVDFFKIVFYFIPKFLIFEIVDFLYIIKKNLYYVCYYFIKYFFNFLEKIFNFNYYFVGKNLYIIFLNICAEIILMVEAQIFIFFNLINIYIPFNQLYNFLALKINILYENIYLAYYNWNEFLIIYIKKKNLFFLNCYMLFNKWHLSKFNMNWWDNLTLLWIYNILIKFKMFVVEFFNYYFLEPMGDKEKFTTLVIKGEVGRKLPFFIGSDLHFNENKKSFELDTSYWQDNAMFWASSSDNTISFMQYFKKVRIEYYLRRLQYYKYFLEDTFAPKDVQIIFYLQFRDKMIAKLKALFQGKYTKKEIINKIWLQDRYSGFTEYDLSLKYQEHYLRDNVFLANIAVEHAEYMQKKRFGDNPKAYLFLGTDSVFDKQKHKSDVYKDYVSLDMWVRSEIFGDHDLDSEEIKKYYTSNLRDFNKTDLAHTFDIYDSQEQYEFMEWNQKTYNFYRHLMGFELGSIPYHFPGYSLYLNTNKLNSVETVEFLLKYLYKEKPAALNNINQFNRIASNDNFLWFFSNLDHKVDYSTVWQNNLMFSDTWKDLWALNLGSMDPFWDTVLHISMYDYDYYVAETWLCHIFSMNEHFWVNTYGVDDLYTNIWEEMDTNYGWSFQKKLHPRLDRMGKVFFEKLKKYKVEDYTELSFFQGDHFKVRMGNKIHPWEGLTNLVDSEWFGPGRLNDFNGGVYMGDHSVSRVNFDFGHPEDTIWFSAYMESLVTAPLDKMYIWGYFMDRKAFFKNVYSANDLIDRRVYDKPMCWHYWVWYDNSVTINNLQHNFNDFLTEVSNYDAPHHWQFGFQDPVSPIMEGIIDLHHDLIFFMILVLTLVVWVLINILYSFNTTYFYTNFSLYRIRAHFLENFLQRLHVFGLRQRWKVVGKIKWSSLAPLYKLWAKILIPMLFVIRKNIRKYKKRLLTNYRAVWIGEETMKNIVLLYTWLPYAETKSVIPGNLNLLLNYNPNLRTSFKPDTNRLGHGLNSTLENKPSDISMDHHKLNLIRLHNFLGVHLNSLQSEALDAKGYARFGAFWRQYIAKANIDLLSTMAKWMRRERVWFPKTFTHHTLIEIVWTIIPALILIAIALPSFSLLYAMDQIWQPLFTIKVLGNQWYWNYEYC